MVEQCSDPECVARELGVSLTAAAEALLAGATLKGPMGVSSVSLIGRILGARWAQPVSPARSREDDRQAFAARVSAALTARLVPPGTPPGQDSVTDGAAPRAQLPF
jgi:hypothetical protein